MTNSSIIERVALAAARASGIEPPPYDMERWRAIARATISAMRDPTPAIVEAMGDALRDHEAWILAIDAALGEDTARGSARGGESRNGRSYRDLETQ